MKSAKTPPAFPKRDSGIDGTIHRTVAPQEARRSRPPGAWPIRLPSRKGGREEGPIPERVPIRAVTFLCGSARPEQEGPPFPSIDATAGRSDNKIYVDDF